MNTKKIIVPLIVLGAVGLAVYAYKTKEDATDFIDNAKFDLVYFNIVPGSFVGSGFKKLNYKLGIKITNPTKFNVEIENIYVNVFLNKQKVTKIESTKTFEIKPFKALVFDNNLELNLSEAIPAVYKTITKAIEDKFIDVNLVGYVQTNLGKLSFDVIKKVSFN